MFIACYDCMKMFYNGFNKYTIPYHTICLVADTSQVKGRDRYNLMLRKWLLNTLCAHYMHLAYKYVNAIPQPALEHALATTAELHEVLKLFCWVVAILVDVHMCSGTPTGETTLNNQVILQHKFISQLQWYFNIATKKDNTSIHLSVSHIP